MSAGTIWEPGGVVAPTDYPLAGQVQWDAMTGISPDDPLIGGSLGGTNDNAAANRGRVIGTLPGGAAAAAGDPASAAATSFTNSWRDLFNLHSPAPWVLLFLFAAIGLVSGRVALRAGPVSAGGGIG